MNTNKVKDKKYEELLVTSIYLINAPGYLNYTSAVKSSSKT